ncbi:Nif3-like dinuclear metal center hexameric protein [Nitriliruptor alkaliphilus]|uniref:Nif3-like dinuclear metal center hexameric protein n=1 Tax=Nitriliruptor alkaliphilus TaxID=427918 RepID=UPI000698C0C7|nr:Nif3-like dinuclear metal center hexameric protein [Nitriliruptor alkaliphilus]
MPETVGDWLTLIHERYPPAEAASWDHVGLQVGDPAWDVTRVLVCLDVTGDVIREAAQVAGTLVLAHHPLLFRPLASLTPGTASGRTALLAATERVPVVAAHTNLDVARDGAGTSDPVAEALSLTDRRPLTTELRDSERCKLVTFVPESHVDPVLDALAAAGAGTIGDYERCAFRVAGQGTFRPGPAATPFSGEVGQVALEDEVRLEMEVPRRGVGAAVRALLAAHPYEEVAYDLLPMLTGATVGFGVVGSLPGPLALSEVAAALRDRLPAPHLRVAGDPDRVVRTVAAVGGAGDGLIGAALAAGVDVYVTGDLRHHVTLDAVEQGLALIDAGHHATEVAALPHWIAALTDAASRRGLAAPVVASNTPTVPWR